MANKILITGASGGFGYLISKSLIENGHQVVGTMRSTKGKNEQVANKLKSIGVQLIELDVTDEESVNNGVTKAIEVLNGLDVLINNAGIGAFGIQELFSPEQMLKVYDVNVVGVQRMMRATLPHFRKKGKGTVLYTSSLLGRMVVPFYGVYSNTKFALESLAEHYRTELSGFGVESCIIEPGGFPTTFVDNLMKPSEDIRALEFGDFANAPAISLQHFEDAMENNPEQRPQKVADAVVNILNIPFGDRPFRTTVDYLGMGVHIEKYNEMIHQITKGVYTNFGTEGMMQVKKS